MLSWRSIGLLFIVLHIYLIIGMIAFRFLERDQEEEVKTDTKVYKDAILANFTCLSEDSLESLIRVIQYAVNNGIDPTNTTTSPSNWDWHQTFFFSGTVITTIGKFQVQGFFSTIIYKMQNKWVIYEIHSIQDVDTVK